MGRGIHALYAGIFRLWRKRRQQWFIEVVQPGADDVLLDVGGTAGFWRDWPPLVRRVDCINPGELGAPGEPGEGPAVRLTVGDGCALPCADGEYAIAFSNSVIEHVGDWDRQQAFAAEIRRVGRKLWVQTPAWECPLEPHFLAPFLHWLPRGPRVWVARWLAPRGWLEGWDRAQAEALVDEIRLLRRREMIALFPDCEILTERLLGVFPKSYIAVR